MNVAISCEGTDLQSTVSRRFGTARHFLIIDLETDTLTVAENNGVTAQRGAGVRAVVLLLTEGVDVLLTGYCGPAMRRQLEDNGVAVFPGLTGVAQDILQQYRTGDIGTGSKHGMDTGGQRRAVSREDLRDAARQSLRQVFSMAPMMAGVVLLVGLFNSLAPGAFLETVFSGNAGMDTFWGACAGSLLAGNPINSYIIGGELLGQGLSLFAVTAFMLTWVTVGLVQLPAEMAALGRRFALQRNVACFLLAFPIAIATVLVLAVLDRGLT